MFAPWLPGQVPLVGGSEKFLENQRQRALVLEDELRKKYEPGYIGIKDQTTLYDVSPVQHLPMSKWTIGFLQKHNPALLAELQKK